MKLFSDNGWQMSESEWNEFRVAIQKEFEKNIRNWVLGARNVAEKLKLCLFVVTPSPVVSKINLAKQWPQGTNYCLLPTSIWHQRFKTHHLTFIIWVFVLSIEHPLTKTMGASRGARKGASFSNSTSQLLRFLGTGKRTMLHSRARQRSAHAIILRCHLKSLGSIISASSASVHANEPMAGFLVLFFSATSCLFSLSSIIWNTWIPYSY